MVELAFALPLIVLLMLGILVFGHIYKDYLTLQNAAREGARAAATGKTDEEVEEIILDRCATLNKNNISIKITPEDDDPDRVPGNPVTVEVWYKHYSPVPLMGLVANPKTLYARATMRIESVPSSGTSS